MKNIQNEIYLESLRGIAYGCWRGDDIPVIMQPIPNTMFTRIDDAQFSINLNNHPIICID
jgi:hypothetical protein